MSVRATYNLRLDVTETIETGVDGASNPVVQHDALNVADTLSATSTVPATDHSQKLFNLSGGAKTIDLTAFLGTYNRTIDGTGKKLRIVRFQNNSAASAMTIGKGAANGYDLWGGAAALTVPAGCAVEMIFQDKLPAIDASHKTIDISGAGTDQFALSLVIG